MITRCFSFLVAVAVLAIGTVASARPASPFEAVRAELEARKAALTGVTDKPLKKQFAAVSKALTKLDALDASPAPSLALDIAAGVAVFPILEKAFRLEFPKGLAPTGALGTAAAGAAAAMKTNVESEFVGLTTAIGLIASPKQQKAAQKQANIAGKALGTADVTLTPSTIAKLLKKAHAAVLKGFAIVAKAPVRNTVTATIGTAAYVGQNNYLDYEASAGVLALTSNANTAALGGFASFTFSPFAASVTGPGDYPITGTMYTGTDPGNITSYYISAGTLHLTTFDTTAQRAVGTFTITVAGHPELAAVDGAFDFHTIRLQ